MAECLYCKAGDEPEDLTGDGVKSHTVTLPCGPDGLQKAAQVLASGGISEFRTGLVQALARVAPSEIPGFNDGVAAALHLVINFRG